MHLYRSLGQFIREEIRRVLAKTRIKLDANCTIYTFAFLVKTRTCRINGSRLIWLFIIINLAHPRRKTVNSQLPPFYFSSAKLQIENPFNSIELKQKTTYTGACHAVIKLFRDCQCPAKDENSFSATKV